MKITIVQEFNTAEEAQEFLQRVTGGSDNIQVVVLPNPLPNPLGVDERPETPEPEKKARKPRSDAGQPRGPYKEKPAESAAAATEVVGGASGAVDKKADQTAAAAPAPKEPTMDDVTAAMMVLNKKHGIEANMKQLAAFGVDRKSLLPKARYAEFIAAVLKAAGA